MAIKHYHNLERKWITDKKGVHRQLWVKKDKPKIEGIKKIQDSKAIKMRGGVVKIDKRKELKLPRKDGENKNTEFNVAYKITYANKSQIDHVRAEVRKNGLIYHHDGEYKLTGYAFPQSEKETLDKEIDTDKMN